MAELNGLGLSADQREALVRRMAGVIARPHSDHHQQGDSAAVWQARAALAEVEGDLGPVVAGLRRRATDRQYLIEALASFLGPNGLKVYQAWQESGVQRVHYAWGPDAAELTGDQRAALVLQFDAAPRELLHDVDEHLEQREVSQIIESLATERVTGDLRFSGLAKDYP